MSHKIKSIFDLEPEPKHVPTVQQEATIKLKDYSMPRKIQRAYRPHKAGE